MSRVPSRRDEILATFIRHVASRGYERTNLSDIADELGVSKGTIVHHFGVKAQMLRELEENYMRRQVGAVREMWERLPGPAERVAAFVHASVLLHVLERDATVATQREVLQLAQDPEMLEIRRMRRECQDMVAAELQRGVTLGDFHPLDIRLGTLAMFGSLQWMWTWFDPDGPWAPEEVGSALAEIALGGLLVDRDGIRDLVAPDGPVAKVVRECLGAATQPATAPRSALPGDVGVADRDPLLGKHTA